MEPLLDQDEAKFAERTWHCRGRPGRSNLSRPTTSVPKTLRCATDRRSRLSGPWRRADIPQALHVIGRVA
nr:hypothetical protein CFP56_34935 [Quercus suber]